MLSQGKIQSLYYELELRTEGMEAGKAKTAALLRDLEIVAAKTGKSIDDVALAVGRSGAGAKGLHQIAEGFRSTSDNAGKASLSLHSFLRPLESLATEAIGANAQVGNLASKLSLLGLGAGVTTGILLGLTAIATAWDRITEGARKARREVEEFIARGLKLSEDQARTGIAGPRTDLERADRERAAAVDRLAKAEKALQDLQQSDEVSITASVRAARELLKARRDLADATKVQVAYSRDYVKASQDVQAADAQTLGNLLLAGGTSKDRSRAADLLHDLRLELKGLGAELPERRAQIEGLIDALTAADKAAAARGVKAEARTERVGGVMEQLQQLKASLTPTEADALTVRLGALQTALSRLSPTAEELRAFKALRTEIEELAATATKEDLAKQLRDVVSASTISLVDDLTDKLEDLKKALAAKGATAEFIAQITAIQQAVIDATKASEAAIGSANLVNTDSPTNAIQKVKALLDIQDSLDAARDKTKVGTAAWKIYGEAIDAVKAKIKALQDTVTGLGDPTAETTAHIRETALAIQQGVDGAIQLAAAFGLVDAQVANVLRSIGQVAAGIGPLLNAIKLMQAGTGGAGAVFGAALPVLGGLATVVSSLFGKSPEEAARLQALKENSQRLRELTQHVGDLARTNVTGTDLARFTAFLNDPRLKNVRGEPGSALQNNDIGAILAGFGITGEELKAFAQQFRIAVGTGPGGKITIDDINALLKALQNEKLTQFADDFTGEMAKMDAEIRIFSLSKPIQQFEEFRKVLASIHGGPGALGGLLQGLDLTTSAGIDAARKAVEDLFNQFSSLSGDALASFLGGLTPEDFVNAIEKLTDLINAQASGGGIAGTGGFNVDRTITETTGNRLEALLSTNNILEERTAIATELIASIMGGGIVPMISPPSMPAPAFGSGAMGAVTLNVGPITVNLGGATDPITALKTGELVSRAMIEEIDQKLGTRSKFAKLTRGVISK